MPTYEYACQDCGEHLEVVQSFKDKPLEECGKCGGRLRKVFSAAGIIFKGSGYYVTDSRKKSGDSGSSGGSAGKDSAGKNPAGKDSGTKSDTPKTEAPKPAPKAESA